MSADELRRPWRPFRLRMSENAAAGVEGPPAPGRAPETSPDEQAEWTETWDRLRALSGLQGTGVSAIGYAPDPTPTPRPVPAKVTHVVLRFDSGAEVSYPVKPPHRLTRPPTGVEFIGGAAFLDRE